MIQYTVEAYKLLKYDDDYVDLLVYNDVNYKHFILFEGVITVYTNDDCDIVDEFPLNTENFAKALELIK